jgi:hypothetical protein
MLPVSSRGRRSVPFVVGTHHVNQEHDLQHDGWGYTKSALKEKMHNSHLLGVDIRGDLLRQQRAPGQERC